MVLVHLQAAGVAPKACKVASIACFGILHKEHPNSAYISVWLQKITLLSPHRTATNWNMCSQDYHESQRHYVSQSASFLCRAIRRMLDLDVSCQQLLFI